MTEPAIRLHEDRAMFREAVAFTADRTGFVPRLIEKDYFCTLALQYLARQLPDMIFKGGTCLAKVHTGFYRLSEDLDFVVPTDAGATRAARRQAAAVIKKAVDALPDRLGEFHEVEPLTGASESTQYNAILGYTSLLGSQSETIKIEVSLREPLVMRAIPCATQTLLLDPISGQAWVPAIQVPCIALQEAMAEKLRAALSRRQPAIRDFFDVDYAVRIGTLDVGDDGMLRMVRTKLHVVGNAAVDVSPARLAALQPQVEAELRPVLREPDFTSFDLGRAFDIVAHLAALLETTA